MQLALPEYYKPEDVGRMYEPRMEMLIAAALAARSQVPSVDRSASKRWSAMVSIDEETCFVLPQFPLAVKGAIEDVRRGCELLYRRPDLFDENFITLDQHLRLSIFSRLWWINKDGQHPEYFTKITLDDLLLGKWKPIMLDEWSFYYLKKMGYIDIWPPHGEIGTDGARLVPAWEEAIWWHAVVRNTKPIVLLKGDLIEVEFYGALCPNVRVSGHPRGGLLTDALNLLGRYDRTFWKGQSKDFCVIASLLQHIEYFEGRPEVLKRVFLIEDCMSLVYPDRKAENDAILEDLRAKGVTIVTSDEVLAMAA